MIGTALIRLVRGFFLLGGALAMGIALYAIIRGNADRETVTAACVIALACALGFAIATVVKHVHAAVRKRS